MNLSLNAASILVQRQSLLVAVGLALATLLSPHSRAQFVSLELEEPPLSYSATTADNRISRLIAEIESGAIKLEYDRQRGYLRSLLQHLGISEASQVLVFSKTSMQIQHISPRNPRAVYFNDDTYLGWIPGSSLVEISTNDPKLGAAFYTLKMTLGQPKIQQETYQCLACHATAMTQGVPGHTVRSGFPDYDGRFDVQRESFVTDEMSPFSQRWGGWYVSGTHGDMEHMGNAYLRGGSLDRSRGSNMKDLDELFNTDSYLTPYSDIQALMVLEHQSQMHNTITRADFNVRALLHKYPDQEEAERRVQLQLIAKGIVDRLLFCDEFVLTSPIAGTSGYEKAFLDLGPKDSQGRSLREFDMQTRMFKYPLSYLIYSEAFDAMQPRLHREVCRQVLEILNGKVQSEEYKHLTPALRQQILEIVRDTKPVIVEATTDY
jgi:hypothetical protein